MDKQKSGLEEFLEAMDTSQYDEPSQEDTEKQTKVISETSNQEENDFVPDEETVEEQTEQEKEKEIDWQKRFKDTEKTYQKEHQRLKQLEKELETLKSQKDTSIDKKEEDDDDYSSLFTDLGLDDDKKSNSKKEKSSDEIETIKEKLERLERETAQVHWKNLEDKFKKTKKLDDYDELVYDLFEPAITEDKKLYDEFVEKGGTPEVAYRMAKKIKLLKDLGDDPDAALEKMLEERSKNRQSTSDTLSSLSSSPPSEKSKNKYFESKTVLDGVLESIG